MITVFVSHQIIKETLHELRQVGRRCVECVVLWLGCRDDKGVSVKTVWIPEQEVGYGLFRIPENAMEQLFSEMRNRRLMIAAQIHTHPQRAFHSHADDKWAIVRHVGALSLVLPYFAQKTQLNNFKSHAAVFALSKTNEWIKVPKRRASQFYYITP